MLISEVVKLKKALSGKVQERGLLGVVAFGIVPGENAKLDVSICGTDVMPQAVKMFIDEIALAELGRMLNKDDMSVNYSLQPAEFQNAIRAM